MRTDIEEGIDLVVDLMTMRYEGWIIDLETGKSVPFGVALEKAKEDANGIAKRN